jgi:hypothetical protein
MDEDVNRYALELIEAINAAIAQSPEVQRCRARARAAGVELSLAFEARGLGQSQEGPARREAPRASAASRSRSLGPRLYTITAADRRFLRSLRIAADETPEPVE